VLVAETTTLQCNQQCACWLICTLVADLFNSLQCPQYPCVRFLFSRPPLICAVLRYHEPLRAGSTLKAASHTAPERSYKQRNCNNCPGNSRFVLIQTCAPRLKDICLPDKVRTAIATSRNFHARSIIYILCILSASVFSYSLLSLSSSPIRSPYAIAFGSASTQFAQP